MKILVKFPTRSRGDHFVKVLEKYVNTSSDPKRVHYLISYDEDDATMTDMVITKSKQIAGKHITMVSGISDNKIHACNRDVNEFKGKWDVIILASDDMIPQVNGWDRIIETAMMANFSNLDGVLWFNDGHQDRISTFCIMGKAYYDRFGYLYHPDYISLFCDNEFTEVAQKLGRIKYYPNVIFFHEHPMWIGRRDKMDDLYKLNEGYYNADKQTYLTRRRTSFQ